MHSYAPVFSHLSPQYVFNRIHCLFHPVHRHNDGRGALVLTEGVIVLGIVIMLKERCIPWANRPSSKDLPISAAIGVWILF